MMLHPGGHWFLLLLLLLPLPQMLRRRRRVVLRHASVPEMASLPGSWALRLSWIVPVLRAVVLILLVFAMARPQVADERTRLRTRGIAIQLVIDRSGSMDAVDYSVAGREQTRLEVVREVVERFVAGDEQRGGRDSDLIGVIAFGTFADVLCPLTLDQDHVVRVVRSIEVPPRPDERGTAIGDGLALAVERLRPADSRAAGAEDVTGRVVVLLTDGENNSGDIDPLVAAEIARAMNVRVYAIGVGSARGVATLPSVDPLTGRRQQLAVGIDEEVLRRIAERTGGRYFLATDRRSLEEIYLEIDQLERREIEDMRFVDVQEASIHSVRLFGARYWPPIVLIALVVLAVELTLGWTRLGRLGG